MNICFILRRDGAVYDFKLLGLDFVLPKINNSDRIPQSTGKDGRVVECAGLEIRYTVIPYRGFKSLSFRQNIWLTQPYNILKNQ